MAQPTLPGCGHPIAIYKGPADSWMYSVARYPGQCRYQSLLPRVQCRVPVKVVMIIMLDQRKVTGNCLFLNFDHRIEDSDGFNVGPAFKGQSLSIL